jgi:ArsR family transcriptional regulator, arsenate/arsenite/antimonite-responsive transcriptional repressor
MESIQGCSYEAFLQALSSRSRQTILEFLSEREMTVSELTEQMALSQPTVSHHLRLLRRAGLVHLRREGTWIFYTANSRCLAACCQRLFRSLHI